jgi:AraC-like DNA-binding protein
VEQVSAYGLLMASVAAQAGGTRVRLAEHLRPYVAGWADFDMAGWPPGRHRGLPDASLVLVVSCSTPLVVRRADHPDLSAVASVAGLRSGPVDIIHDGTQRGVQLELTPRGARALLGMPAAALAEGAWPLDEVVGRRARHLISRLAEAPGPAERAGVLDVVLSGWVREDDGFPVTVDAFWRRLVATAGSASVTSIVGEMGLGRRYLGQLVRAELGLTPKTAARILRFGRVGRLLRSGRADGLAETAAMCGYFDQAHLTNDWKKLAGCTPGEWMSEELPFLQDPGAADGGD